MDSSELSRDEIVKAAMNKIAEETLEESFEDLMAAAVLGATTGIWPTSVTPSTTNAIPSLTPYEVSFHTETGEWRQVVSASCEMEAIKKAIPEVKQSDLIVHHFAVRKHSDAFAPFKRISIEEYTSWLSSQAPAASLATSADHRFNKFPSHIHRPQGPFRVNSETTITSVARIVRQESDKAAANQWIEYLAYDATGQLIHSVTFHGPAEGIVEDRRYE